MSHHNLKKYKIKIGRIFLPVKQIGETFIYFLFQVKVFALQRAQRGYSGVKSKQSCESSALKHQLGISAFSRGSSLLPLDDTGTKNCFFGIKFMS